MLAERTPAAQKLDDLLSVAVRLQLRHPTGTFQSLTAVFVMASEGGFTKAMSLSPQLKQSSLQHLKKVFKAGHRWERTASNTHKHNFIKHKNSMIDVD